MLLDLSVWQLDSLPWTHGQSFLMDVKRTPPYTSTIINVFELSQDNQLNRILFPCVNFKKKKLYFLCACFRCFGGLFFYTVFTTCTDFPKVHPTWLHWRGTASTKTPRFYRSAMYAKLVWKPKGGWPWHLFNGMGL